VTPRFPGQGGTDIRFDSRRKEETGKRGRDLVGSSIEPSVREVASSSQSRQGKGTKEIENYLRSGILLITPRQGEMGREGSEILLSYFRRETFTNTEKLGGVRG